MLLSKAFETLNSFKTLKQVYDDRFCFHISDEYRLVIFFTNPSGDSKVSSESEVYSVDIDCISDGRFMRDGFKTVSVQSVWEKLPDDFREEAAYHLDLILHFKP